MQRILPPKETSVINGLSGFGLLPKQRRSNQVQGKSAEERYGTIGERSQERRIGLVKPLQNPRARYQ